MMCPRPRLRSIRYLAKLLGVSRQTARRYCVSGLVRAQKTPGGGRWRVPQEECERLQRAGFSGGPPETTAVASGAVLAKLKRLGIG